MIVGSLGVVGSTESGSVVITGPDGLEERKGHRGGAGVAYVWWKAKQELHGRVGEDGSSRCELTEDINVPHLEFS